MKDIRLDMQTRNIKDEYIDLEDYITIKDSKEINEKKLISDIEGLQPKMIILVLCYSHTLDLKFLLEEHGIFAKARFNRDLCIQSRGQILTMTETQKEFLETIAKHENVTKRIVKIDGQVGSGKTLMAIEAAKIKVSHYLRTNKWTAAEGIDKIRVIIIIELGDSNVLKEQLDDDLMKDIGKQATLEIYNEDLEEEINPKGLKTTEKRQQMKEGIEFKKPGDDEFGSGEVEEGDQFMAVKPWIGVVNNSVPDGYRPSKRDGEAPDATLDLDYVHGFRCHDIRNNLRYTADGKLAYCCAGIGVIMDQKSNT